MRDATGWSAFARRDRGRSCSWPSRLRQLRSSTSGERWFGWGPADPRTEPAGRRAARRAASCPPPGSPRSVARTGGRRRRRPGRGGGRRAAVPAQARCSGRHFGVLVTDLRTGRRGLPPGRRRRSPRPRPPSCSPRPPRWRRSARWPGSARRCAGSPRTGSSCSSAAATRSWPARPRRGRVGYPHRADVVTLAQRDGAQAAARCTSRRVRLAYDDSYFTGPAVNPAWPATYIPEERGAADQRAVGRRGPRAAAATASSDDPAAAAAPGLRGPRCVDAGLAGRPRGTPRRQPAGRRRRRLGLQRPARRDRRAHPRGQRQPGRRGAGPPRRAWPRSRRARSRPAPRPCSRCCAGSAYPSPATGSTTAAGSPATTGSPRPPWPASSGWPSSRRAPGAARRCSPGCRSPASPARCTYRFDKGPDEARGRVRAKTGTLTGVHGLAGVADDAEPAPGWPSWSSPTGCRLLKNLEAQTLIDRIAARAGRVQVRRRVDAMSQQEPSGRPGMIDWDLAVRVGSRLVGEGPQVTRAEAVDGRRGAARRVPSAPRRWSASSPAWSPASAPRRCWSSTGRAGSRPTPTASRR